MIGNNIKYLLGIDGGGTKTEFLLTDLGERKIKQIVLGTSNPVNVGTENCKSVLKQGIFEICDGLNYEEISVFAGLAGSGSDDIKSEVHRFLGEFQFGAYSNGSDADSVLEVALKGENGVAVIMGTGIIAYARSGEKLHRTGGRGCLIDKGGSGFHFGSDALNSAFEFLDGRGGSETILALVEKRLGKSLGSSVNEIYKGGAAYIASFAPVVFEAFNLGDSKSSEIIDRNAHEAAKIINGARIFSGNCNDKIVVCGGLCKQKEILYPFLMKYLDNEARLTFLDEPMVNGAISIAARRAEIC